jgi:uncharacterized protein
MIYLFVISAFLLGKSAFGVHKSPFRVTTHLPASLEPSAADQPNVQDITFEVVSSITKIEKMNWNRLLQAEDSPFLDYEWIHALESTGLATTSTGWQPVHLCAYRNTSHGSGNRELIAAVPTYAKAHSMGEFIFDQSWADYAERALGIRYYPKLLTAVPFTPAVGKRILTHPSLSSAEIMSVRQQVAVFLAQLVDDNLLSGAHVNWMLPDEVDAFVTRTPPQNPRDYGARLADGIGGLLGGPQRDTHRKEPPYLLRETIQYRFVNMNKETGLMYRNFDEYLSFFKSKRRGSIRRERRSVYEDSKLRVEVIRGDDPRADLNFFMVMHTLYTTTVDKMWGQRYLSSAFFAALFAASPEFKRSLVFVVAFDDDSRDGSEAALNVDSLPGASTSDEGEGEIATGKIVGGTINVAKHDRFYGRYWGSFADVKNLHFECCYYKTIEFCIENGIKYFEPGAGGGSFKFLRGFDPYIVNSVHYLAAPALRSAVADFLGAERFENGQITQFLTENSKLQSRDNPSAGTRDRDSPGT